MSDDTPIKADVFIDYTCPWVRQAGIWLRRVELSLGESLELRYRSFALEQVNSDQGEDWKAWEQGEDYLSRGLWPLRGGIAARMQSAEAHRNYMATLQEFKFVERGDIRSRTVVVEMASTAGLDMVRFVADIDDPARLSEIGSDHQEAAAMGVFGTPTFVFEDGTSAFLKTFTPPESDTLSAWDALISMARNRPYFGELKRPQPPWPQGVDVS